MEQPNFYAIIPANIRYAEDLSEFQKLLYAEITALAQKDGYCWASNSYFSKVFTSPRKDENGKIQKRNPNAISNAINDLAKKGYISVEIEKEKGNTRKIFVGQISFKKAQTATIHQNMDTIHENMETYTPTNVDPIHEKVEYNNINIIIKNNNIKNAENLKNFGEENYKTNQSAYLLKSFFKLGYIPAKEESIDSFRKWFKEKIIDKYKFNTVSDLERIIDNFETYWLDEKTEKERKNKNWKSTFINNPYLNNFRK
ncbi:hypothetical protein DLH72_01250 [Candidatus Gracilibacteria bacterium]|nr:MAG: hypothetical protein DLH72_01250 [Candidatus Gracilibacteria bacterium]